MSNDPYQVLKVHPSAKLEDIKKAYRELVKIHHPDKGGNTKIMLEINSSWEILKKKNQNPKAVYTHLPAQLPFYLKLKKLMK